MTAAPNIAAPALDRPAAGIVDQDRVLAPVVAVLFCRRDSIYKTLPGCEVYDIDRDARTYHGDDPAVCHPPCKLWGELAHMATPVPGEKEHALFAVDVVRRNGGVLEHPIGSKLWAAAGIPAPNSFLDDWGGWTLDVRQFDFGHRAEKWTRLYIVGADPAGLTLPPRRRDRPTHVISTGHGLRVGHPSFRSRVTDAEREHTPLALAQWLLSVARTCRSQNIGAQRRENDHE